MATRTTREYRCGIIGCGGIGSDGWEQGLRAFPGYFLFPYSHAGVYQRHPRTRLVAAADIDPARLRAFGERWGVSALYLDYQEMLARERLDLVSIATPTRVRPAVTISAAGHHVKGIFLEKPIARTLGEADAMAQACRDAGVKVAVNHYRTYEPSFRAARAFIAGGEIGTLHAAMATWAEGFSEGGCHLLELLRWIVGAPVDWGVLPSGDNRSHVDLGGDAYIA
jgi:UDP-N-acetyl-2-amino-2-deoxyglucuronate dehydrogenase